MKQLTVATSIIIGLGFTLSLCHAAQLQQLEYDANGNLITGDGFYREFDGYNHLVRVREGNVAGGTIVEEQEWDLLEERVLARRTYTAGTLNKTTIYWTKEFVQVINASGGATTNETYVYLNDRPVAQRVNEDTTFIHSDHLGSSTIITSAIGQVTERTIYEPYGKPITGAAQSRLDYTGKEQLPTASDYDYSFRRYNPNWGIFTQPDNLLPNIYNPQQFNRFTYARSNPYKYFDPDGHDGIIVNYDLDQEIGGYDPGHSSVVVGNDEDGWTAMWFGSAETTAYSEGSDDTGFTETQGQVITGKGETWQEAIQNMEENSPRGVIGPHEQSSAVRFSTTKEQDAKMTSHIESLAANQKDLKYSPLGSNCADVVSNVLQSGGVRTSNFLRAPRAYKWLAKFNAAANNVAFRLKAGGVRALFGSKTKTGASGNKDSGGKQK